MLKISKLVASIAIASSAIVSASANAAIVGCKLETPDYFFGDQNCNSGNLLVQAKASMEFYAQVSNGYRNKIRSSAAAKVSLLNYDGSVLYTQYLVNASWAGSPTVTKVFINQDRYARNFKVRATDFNGPYRSGVSVQVKHI